MTLVDTAPTPRARPFDCLVAHERADEIAEEFFPGFNMLELSSSSRKKMMFSAFIAEFLQQDAELAIDEQEDTAIYQALKKLDKLETEGIFEGGALRNG